MKDSENKNNVSRRDVLKSIATVPVLGAYAYAYFKKKRIDRHLNMFISSESDDVYKAIQDIHKGTTIRLGIIGCGARGTSIMHSAGFSHPNNIDSLLEKATSNSRDKRYEYFMKQPDLNIEFTGICDLFDPRAEWAQIASANKLKSGKDNFKATKVQRFNTYKELIHSNLIDAVIVATSDNWHAPITIEAARAGKHVYCEKPMTNTLEETYRVRKEVKESGIIYQLGHQNRQIESYKEAIELLNKGIFGKLTLIETSTNRNSSSGAWQFPIHEKGSESTIDWKQFVGDKKTPFNLDKFFRWRCYWDFGSGLSGDMLTHEYDCINQILKLGIPSSVVASGGIYYWKDGREVPDVLNVLMEYPNKGITMSYSASLASDFYRNRLIRGSDATLELTDTINIIPDSGSERYANKASRAALNELLRKYATSQEIEDVDALTSATSSYFAKRGLLYTSKGNVTLDTTFLHIEEWLRAIRDRGSTSCDIDQGFEEAVIAHLAGISYRENRKVFWDSNTERLVT